MYIYIYRYIRTYIYIYIHIHILMYVVFQTVTMQPDKLQFLGDHDIVDFAHTNICICIYICIYIYTHVYIHTYIYTYIYLCMYVHVYTCIDVCSFSDCYNVVGEIAVFPVNYDINDFACIHKYAYIYTCYI